MVHSVEKALRRETKFFGRRPRGEPSVPDNNQVRLNCDRYRERYQTVLLPYQERRGTRQVREVL